MQSLLFMNSLKHYFNTYLYCFRQITINLNWFQLCMKNMNWQSWQNVKIGRKINYGRKSVKIWKQQQILRRPANNGVQNGETKWRHCEIGNDPSDKPERRLVRKSLIKKIILQFLLSILQLLCSQLCNVFILFFHFVLSCLPSFVIFVALTKSSLILPQSLFSSNFHILSYFAFHIFHSE